MSNKMIDALAMGVLGGVVFMVIGLVFGWIGDLFRKKDKN
jgi:hypothetical protein